MKQLLTFVFLIFSLFGFAQEKTKTPLSAELQKEKLVELESITDNMSFASKERYLDSLQNSGVIVRNTNFKKNKGCTLEDRETMFGKPQEETIIFLKN